MQVVYFGSGPSEQEGEAGVAGWGRRKKPHTDVWSSCSISLAPFEKSEEINLRTVTLGNIQGAHLSDGSQWVRVVHQGHNCQHIWATHVWAQGDTLVALGEADQSRLWTCHQNSSWSRMWGCEDLLWCTEVLMTATVSFKNYLPAFNVLPSSVHLEKSLV